MQNLIRFIQRHQFFFLFLLLVTGAVLLTASHQQYQQTFFLRSTNAIAGRVYNTVNQFTGYLVLNKVNRQLLEDNTRLLGRQRENFIVSDETVFMAGDTLYQRRFTYMHADVINNSVTRRNNYLTLNKGLAHGMAPDMGLITSAGIAGIVVNVSEHFSVAMSLLHSDMLVSAKILKNDHIGTLSWEGNNYRKAHMSYIPPHVELEPGDTIVTSGYSTVFPENIFIGTIEDWKIRRGETFYTATIDLAMDFNTIPYVYVVKNLMKEEQDELELSVLPDL